MFKKDDEKYLKRLIGRNEVVLFLGAGFSRGAINRLGEPFPTGPVLGEKIWSFLKYKGDYDGTSLPEMYQAFLNAGIKRDAKVEFLESNLLCESIPGIYDTITIPFWYKIYQINIDDIIDKVYSKNRKNVQNLVFPKDEYKERDQSLETTQVVYLHGKLPCNPEDLVFSTKQYAKSQLSHQPLYGQFVYDYAVKPTIFIGTDLNEQIFERYIESREGKIGYSELRPRSFLITPSLSPVKADNFRNQYNVHHISGTTEDFLKWLKGVSKQLPKKADILKSTFPNLLSLSSFADLTNISHRSVSEFASAFDRIPKEYKIKQERSGYLTGASPTWNDIFRDLDIPRTLTDTIYFSIEDAFAVKSKTDKIQVFTVIGTAGSGKSTLLKRMGLQLSQNGRTAFLCYSEFIPRIDYITNVLAAIKERVVILFDNSKNVLHQLVSMLNAFNTLENPPILVFSLRSNHFDKMNLVLDPQIVDHNGYSISDLDDREIKDLIEVLDKNNLLGLLKGMADQARFKEFKYRAKKQILVAMKEATNGKSFNEIIRDEFNEINPEEAKVLCLCIALNTELGFTNTRQDFVGFSKASHSEALNYLNTVLNGTVLWVGSNNDKFMIRHRILADFMIKHCASPDALKEAYIRVLSVLAPELKNSQTHSRKFNLYKSLVNHKILYNRFRNNINRAREVYDSISDFFHNDAHFWLQYGSLEIEGEGGDLELAENYLNQAESINPKYHYIQNAKCSLYYRQSYSQKDYSVALEYKIKADDLVDWLLSNSAIDDPHTHHISCRGRYYFIDKWIKDKEEKKEKLLDLKNRIERAFKLYPRDKKLDQALAAISRAYIQLGINDVDLPNPEIAPE